MAERPALLDEIKNMISGGRRSAALIRFVDERNDPLLREWILTNIIQNM